MARSVDLARILALCVYAGQEWSTVIIDPALSFNCFGRYNRTWVTIYTVCDACGTLTYDAGYVAISPAGWQAGALGLVVDSSAGGSLRTGVRSTDRVASLAGVVASLIRWTIIVCATLHIDACNQGVALKTDSADASRLVVFHKTLCTTAARSVSVQARIQAILVDAGLVQWAVVVDPALRPVALAVWVSPIALRTSAYRMVHTCSALGLWSTWVLHDARVDAVFVDTSFVHRTF